MFKIFRDCTMVKVSFFHKLSSNFNVHRSFILFHIASGNAGIGKFDMGREVL